MNEAAVDYRLQDMVYRALQERPDWRDSLAEMVAWEQAHEDADLGWEWSDVHTSTYQINAMVAAGLVDVQCKSRAYTHYRLRSLLATEEALEVGRVAPKRAEPVDTEALFSLVVGHDRIKQLLRFAIQATAPVHCLLVGPVGTAKTLILSDIARLPGAHFYLGSTTTRSGLVGLLLAHEPDYLILDEVDKMDDRDLTPLLSLMETGMVTRLQHGHQERVTLGTRVFAGANDLRRLSAPILSRFAHFQIQAYTPGEFVEVVQAVLTRREGLGPEMSRHIAAEVVSHSLDIRDAVRVARMARGHPARVVEIVHCLWPGQDGGRVTALPRRA